MSAKFSTKQTWVKVKDKHVELFIVVFGFQNQVSTVIDSNGNVQTKVEKVYTIQGNVKVNNKTFFTGKTYEGIGAFHVKINSIHPVTKEEFVKVLESAIEKGIVTATNQENYVKIYLCLDTDLEGKPRSVNSKWTACSPNPKLKVTLDSLEELKRSAFSGL